MTNKFAAKDDYKLVKVLGYNANRNYLYAQAYPSGEKMVVCVNNSTKTKFISYLANPDDKRYAPSGTILALFNVAQHKDDFYSASWASSVSKKPEVERVIVSPVTISPVIDLGNGKTQVLARVLDEAPIAVSSLQDFKRTCIEALRNGNAGGLTGNRGFMVRVGFENTDNAHSATFKAVGSLTGESLVDHHFNLKKHPAQQQSELSQMVTAAQNTLAQNGGYVEIVGFTDTPVFNYNNPQNDEKLANQPNYRTFNAGRQIPTFSNAAITLDLQSNNVMKVTALPGKKVINNINGLVGQHSKVNSDELGFTLPNLQEVEGQVPTTPQFNEGYHVAIEKHIGQRNGTYNSIVVTVQPEYSAAFHDRIMSATSKPPIQNGNKYYFKKSLRKHVESTLSDLAGTPAIYTNTGKIDEKRYTFVLGRTHEPQYSNVLNDIVARFGGRKLNGGIYAIPEENQVAALTSLDSVIRLPSKEIPQAEIQSAQQARLKPNEGEERQKYVDWLDEVYHRRAEDIADAMDSKISAVAEEAGIDWDRSKTNIIWPDLDGDEVFLDNSAYVKAISGTDIGSCTIGVYFNSWQTKKGNEQYGIVINFRNLAKDRDANWTYVSHHDTFEQYNGEVWGNKTVPRRIRKTDEQLAAEKQIKEQQRRQQDKERIATAEILLDKAFNDFTELQPLGYVHSQLEKKKLPQLIEKLNLRSYIYDNDPTNKAFAFEVFDVHGRFTGYQYVLENPIPTGRPGKTTTKKFCNGLLKDDPATGLPLGTHRLIGSINPSKPHKIFYFEGVFDAGSNEVATGAPSVLCLDKGNMKKVIALMKIKYPHHEHIHVADNDMYSSENGNVGVIAAIENSFNLGVPYVVPKVSAIPGYIEKKLSDTSDLFVYLGAKELSDQLSKTSKIEDEYTYHGLKLLYVADKKLREQIAYFTLAYQQSNHAPELMLDAIGRLIEHRNQMYATVIPNYSPILTQSDVTQKLINDIKDQYGSLAMPQKIEYTLPPLDAQAEEVQETDTVPQASARPSAGDNLAADTTTELPLDENKPSQPSLKEKADRRNWQVIVQRGRHPSKPNKSVTIITDTADKSHYATIIRKLEALNIPYHYDRRNNRILAPYKFINIINSGLSNYTGAPLLFAGKPLDKTKNGIVIRGDFTRAEVRSHLDRVTKQVGSQYNESEHGYFIEDVNKFVFLKELLASHFQPQNPALNDISTMKLDLEQVKIKDGIGRISQIFGLPRRSVAQHQIYLAQHNPQLGALNSPLVAALYLKAKNLLVAHTEFTSRKPAEKIYLALNQLRRELMQLETTHEYLVRAFGPDIEHSLNTLNRQFQITSEVSTAKVYRENQPSSDAHPDIDAATELPTDPQTDALGSDNATRPPAGDQPIAAEAQEQVDVKPPTKVDEFTLTEQMGFFLEPAPANDERVHGELDGGTNEQRQNSTATEARKIESSQQLDTIVLDTDDGVIDSVDVEESEIDTRLKALVDYIAVYLENKFTEVEFAEALKYPGSPYNKEGVRYDDSLFEGDLIEIADSNISDRFFEPESITTGEELFLAFAKKERRNRLAALELYIDTALSHKPDINPQNSSKYMHKATNHGIPNPYFGENGFDMELFKEDVLDLGGDKDITTFRGYFKYRQAIKLASLSDGFTLPGDTDANLHQGIKVGSGMRYVTKMELNKLNFYLVHDLSAENTLQTRVQSNYDSDSSKKSVDNLPTSSVNLRHHINGHFIEMHTVKHKKLTVYTAIDIDTNKSSIRNATFEMPSEAYQALSHWTLDSRPNASKPIAQVQTISEVVKDESLSPKAKAEKIERNTLSTANDQEAIQRELEKETKRPEIKPNVSAIADFDALYQLAIECAKENMTYADFHSAVFDEEGQHYQRNPYVVNDSLDKKAVVKTLNQNNYSSPKKFYDAAYTSVHSKSQEDVELSRTTGVTPTSIDPDVPVRHQFTSLYNLLADDKKDDLTIANQIISQSFRAWTKQPDAVTAIHPILCEDLLKTSASELVSKYSTDAIRLLADLHAIDAREDNSVKALAEKTISQWKAQVTLADVEKPGFMDLEKDHQEALAEEIGTNISGNTQELANNVFKRLGQLNELTNLRLAEYSYIRAAIKVEKSGKKLPAYVYQELRSIIAVENQYTSIIMSSLSRTEDARLLKAASECMEYICQLSEEERNIAELEEVPADAEVVGPDISDSLPQGKYKYKLISGNIFDLALPLQAPYYTTYGENIFITPGALSLDELKSLHVQPVNYEAIYAVLSPLEELFERQSYIAFSTESGSHAVISKQKSAYALDITHIVDDNLESESHTEKSFAAALKIAFSSFPMKAIVLRDGFSDEFIQLFAKEHASTVTKLENIIKTIINGHEKDLAESIVNKALEVGFFTSNENSDSDRISSLAVGIIEELIDDLRISTLNGILFSQTNPSPKYQELLTFITSIGWDQVKGISANGLHKEARFDAENLLTFDEFSALPDPVQGVYLLEMENLLTDEVKKASNDNQEPFNLSGDNNKIVEWIYRNRIYQLAVRPEPEHLQASYDALLNSLTENTLDVSFVPNKRGDSLTLNVADYQLVGLFDTSSPSSTLFRAQLHGNIVVDEKPVDEVFNRLIEHNYQVQTQEKGTEAPLASDNKRLLEQNSALAATPVEDQQPPLRNQQSVEAGSNIRLVGEIEYYDERGAKVDNNDIETILGEVLGGSEDKYKEVHNLGDPQGQSIPIIAGLDPEFQITFVHEIQESPYPENLVIELAKSFEPGKNQLSAQRVKGNVYQIDSAELAEDKQEQGLGVRMYIELLEYAASRGFEIISDKEVSPDALHVYSALKRRGYSVEKSNAVIIHEVDGTAKTDEYVYKISPRQNDESAVKEKNYEVKVQKKYPQGMMLTIMDELHPGITLRTWSRTNEVEDKFWGGDHIVFDPKEHAANGTTNYRVDYESLGGTAVSIRLYLEALKISKKYGLGWRSGSIRSEESIQMYQHLTKLGVPFTNNFDGKGHSISPEQLSKLDINSLIDKYDTGDLVIEPAPPLVVGAIDFARLEYDAIDEHEMFGISLHNAAEQNLPAVLKYLREDAPLSADQKEDLREAIAKAKAQYGYGEFTEELYLLRQNVREIVPQMIMEFRLVKSPERIAMPSSIKSVLEDLYRPLNDELKSFEIVDAVRMAFKSRYLDTAIDELNNGIFITDEEHTEYAELIAEQQSYNQSSLSNAVEQELAEMAKIRPPKNEYDPRRTIEVISESAAALGIDIDVSVAEDIDGAFDETLYRALNAKTATSETVAKARSEHVIENRIKIDIRKGQSAAFFQIGRDGKAKMFYHDGTRAEIFGNYTIFGLASNDPDTQRARIDAFDLAARQELTTADFEAEIIRLWNRMVDYPKKVNEGTIKDSNVDATGRLYFNSYYYRGLCGPYYSLSIENQEKYKQVKQAIDSRYFDDAISHLRNAEFIPSPVSSDADGVIATPLGKDESVSADTQSSIAPSPQLANSVKLKLETAGVLGGANYWYGLKSRPIGAGAQPKNHTVSLNKEESLQLFHSLKDASSIRHGAMAYSAPLSGDEIATFELIALDIEHGSEQHSSSDQARLDRAQVIEQLVDKIVTDRYPNAFSEKNAADLRLEIADKGLRFFDKYFRLLNAFIERKEQPEQFQQLNQIKQELDIDSVLDELTNFITESDVTLASAAQSSAPSPIVEEKHGFVSEKIKALVRDMELSEFQGHAEANMGLNSADAEQIYLQARASIKNDTEEKKRVRAIELIATDRQNNLMNKVVEKLKIGLGDNVQLFADERYPKVKVKTPIETIVLNSGHMAEGSDKTRLGIELQDNRDGEYVSIEVEFEENSLNTSDNTVDEVTIAVARLVDKYTPKLVDLTGLPEYGSATDRNLDNKAIAKEARTLIAKAKKERRLPKSLVVSVTSSHSSIRATITKLGDDIRLFSDPYLEWELQKQKGESEQPANYDFRGEIYSTEVVAILQWVDAHIKAHHWDNSDEYTKFLHAFYFTGGTSVDWNYRRERLAAELLDYEKRKISEKDDLAAFGKTITATEFIEQHFPPAENLEPAGNKLTIDGYALVEHTTRRNKILHGYVLQGITNQQAKLIDPYTFKKNGGFYIRQEYENELREYVANNDEAQLQTKENASQQLDEMTPEIAAKLIAVENPFQWETNLARARTYAQKLNGVYSNNAFLRKFMGNWNDTGFIVSEIKSHLELAKGMVNGSETTNSALGSSSVETKPTQRSEPAETGFKPVRSYPTYIESEGNVNEPGQVVGGTLRGQAVFGIVQRNEDGQLVVIRYRFQSTQDTISKNRDIATHSTTAMLQEFSTDLSNLIEGKPLEVPVYGLTLAEYTELVIKEGKTNNQSIEATLSALNDLDNVGLGKLLKLAGFIGVQECPPGCEDITGYYTEQLKTYVKLAELAQYTAEVITETDLNFVREHIGLESVDQLKSWDIAKKAEIRNRIISSAHNQAKSVGSKFGYTNDILSHPNNISDATPLDDFETIYPLNRTAFNQALKSTRSLTEIVGKISSRDPIVNLSAKLLVSQTDIQVLASLSTIERKIMFAGFDGFQGVENAHNVNLLCGQWIQRVGEDDKTTSVNLIEFLGDAYNPEDIANQLLLPVNEGAYYFKDGQISIGYAARHIYDFDSSVELYVTDDEGKESKISVAIEHLYTNTALVDKEAAAVQAIYLEQAYHANISDLVSRSAVEAIYSDAHDLEKGTNLTGLPFAAVAIATNNINVMLADVYAKSKVTSEHTIAMQRGSFILRSLNDDSMEIFDDAEKLRKGILLKKRQVKGLLNDENKSLRRDAATTLENSLPTTDETTAARRETGTIHPQQTEGIGGKSRSDSQTTTKDDGGSTGQQIPGPNDPSRNAETGSREPSEGTSVPSHGGRSRQLGNTANVSYRFDEQVRAAVDEKLSIDQRFKLNMRAIQLAKTLTSEGREATLDEKHVLAQYRGWGGLAQIVDEDNSSHRTRRAELKQWVNTDEFESIQRSTLSAFYTSPKITEQIWRALERMGLQGGIGLDPAFGTGNFPSTIPTGLMNSVTMHGKELDSLTAEIARHIHGKYVTNQGFEESKIPADYFDFVISNVPFGDFRVFDKQHQDLSRYNIHDYFILKSLNIVKPGGFTAVVTTSGTMDKKSNKARKLIAEQADLIAAVRLPNNAFGDNANTDVKSDFLIFQKRMPNTEPSNVDWIDVTETHIRNESHRMEKITCNPYFIKNPDMVIGEMVAISGQFGLTYTTKFNGDIEMALKDIVDQLPVNIHFDHAENDEVLVSSNQQVSSEESTSGHKVGSYQLDSQGDVCITIEKYTYNSMTEEYDTLQALEKCDLKKATAQRIKGMIKLRDMVRAHINVMKTDVGQELHQQSMKNLNAAYDKYVGKWGPLNGRGNKSVFKADPDSSLLLGLEMWDKLKSVATKADIFTERTIHPKKEITSVENINDALLVSLSEKGKIVPSYIESLTSRPWDELVDELGEKIFKNPTTNKWEDASTYLSGHVRQKLQQAEDAAQVSAEYEINVEALRQVIPQDIPCYEIRVKLGSSWIPSTDMQDFCKYIVTGQNEPCSTQERNAYRVHKLRGYWELEFSSSELATNKGRTESEYGTSYWSADKLIAAIMNNKSINVKRKLDCGTRIVMPEATAEAQAKADLLKETFKEWLWSDRSRSVRLEGIYNSKFNGFIEPKFDGSLITINGLSPVLKGKQFQPRINQLNAIMRYLMTGRTMFLHDVGVGKSFALLGSIIKGKEIGKHSKALLTVPNSVFPQIESLALGHFPNAKILMVNANKLDKDNRLITLSKMATNNWDIIVMPHSITTRLDVPEGFKLKLVEEELSQVKNAISAIKHKDFRTSLSIKGYQRQLENAKQKITARIDHKDSYDTVDISEIGIDAIFVDEADEFVNLDKVTNMKDVAGVSIKESKKARALFYLTKYIHHTRGNQGVVLATGTDIRNNMADQWTLLRFLAPDILLEQDIEMFDDFIGVFGEIQTGYELAPEGTGFIEKTRLSKFTNCPELAMLYRQVADIVTADMAGVERPMVDMVNVVAEPCDYLTAYMKYLGERAKACRSGRPIFENDNLLAIANDGKKAAIDMRLVDSSLPDYPGSKPNLTVQNVLAVYNDNKELKPSQIIFCDIGVPNDEGRFDLYNDIKIKLVRGGIKKENIIFARDYPKEEQKQRLQDMMNAGGIVCIGSTENMGVGKNVQNRLAAIHDVSIPWRHRDMVQRGGRIERFGNIFTNAQRYQYVTRDSFDLFIIQKLKQKALIDEQTKLSPRDAAREIEEEIAPTYGQIMAISTGSPLIQEAIEVESKVEKLSLLSRSHLRAKSERDSQLKDIKQFIENRTLAIENLEQDRKLLGDNKVTILGNSISGGEKGAWDEKAFKAASKKLNKLIRVARESQYSPPGGSNKDAKEPLVTDRKIEIGSISDKTVYMEIWGKKVELLLKNKDKDLLLAIETQAGPLIKALVGKDERLQQDIRWFAGEIERKRKTYESISAVKDVPFPHANELLEAKARLYKIEQELAEISNKEAEKGQEIDPIKHWQMMINGLNQLQSQTRQNELELV